MLICSNATLAVLPMNSFVVVYACKRVGAVASSYSRPVVRQSYKLAVTSHAIKVIKIRDEHIVRDFTALHAMSRSRSQVPRDVAITAFERSGGDRRRRHHHHHAAQPQRQARQHGNHRTASAFGFADEDMSPQPAPGSATATGMYARRSMVQLGASAHYTRGTRGSAHGGSVAGEPKQREKVLKLDLCDYAMAASMVEMTPSELLEELNARRLKRMSHQPRDGSGRGNATTVLSMEGSDKELQEADVVSCWELVIRVGAMSAAFTPADWGNVYSMQKVRGFSARDVRACPTSFLYARTHTDRYTCRSDCPTPIPSVTWCTCRTNVCQYSVSGCVWHRCLFVWSQILAKEFSAGFDRLSELSRRRLEARNAALANIATLGTPRTRNKPSRGPNSNNKTAESRSAKRTAAKKPTSTLVSTTETVIQTVATRRPSHPSTLPAKPVVPVKGSSTKQAPAKVTRKQSLLQLPGTKADAPPPQATGAKSTTTAAVPNKRKSFAAYVCVCLCTAARI